MRVSRLSNIFFMLLAPSFLAALFFRSIASISWAPTRMMGFRLESGSWKTIAILSPLRWWKSSSEIFRRSLSPYRIFPLSTMAFPARIPMMARLVTLFPDPDSPTMASVSPLYKSKSIPLTAWTFPFDVLNEIRRSFTSSFFSMTASLLLGASERRVEGISQSVSEQVERDLQQRDEHCREHDDVRIGRKVCLSVAEHGSD